MSTKFTMKKSNIPARTVQRMLMAVLFAWLLPQVAEAASYVDEAYNYQLMLNGANTIRIKVPVYNEKSDDHWVCNGYIYVQVADDKGNFGSKQTLFWWREDESDDGHDNDDSDLWCKFYTSMGGSFDVTQGNSSNHFTLTKGDGTLRRKVYENADGRTYDIIAVWRLPYGLLGKTLKFSWDVKCDYTNGLAWDTSYSVTGLSDNTITIPAAQDVVTPQVTMATLSYSESGKLELPWFIASTNLTAARYEYTDHNGETVTQTMPIDANNSTIKLDATVPHDNFRVIVSYKDNNNYDIEDVSSQVQDLAMIHAPVGLMAAPTGNGKAAVRLTWGILYPGTDDLADSDFFEVQRSLTGKEEDFVTIGSTPFVLDPQNLQYEYVDSTLVKDLIANDLTGGGTLDQLTYRVRRMMTQNWGWDGNNCAQSASCVVDDIHLLRLSDYSAQWEDERAYTVRVSWDYVEERNAVWDSRAHLKLHVLMKNRDGEPVDSMLYTLTDKERQQCFKIITLSRPCVDYDIKLYVEQGASPIPNYEELTPFYFPIYTEADWNTFRQKVIDAKGQHDVNARLYADISTTNTCANSSSPFCGYFDGNGHSITINVNSTSTYQALFTYAKDYTIENLTVKGAIKGDRHSAGLVGNSDGTNTARNTIRNVRVMADVECSDRYVGGIVGHAMSAPLRISHCLFDGKLKCFGSPSYGGAFIGWCNDNSQIYVTNCLENGTYQGITYTNMCYVHSSGVGIAYNNGGNNINNWSKNGWGVFDNTIVINTAEDWEQFRLAVQDARGQSEVNAIMNANITVTTSVGDDDYPYCGTFNGNGYTLNSNIDGGTTSIMAPFRKVGKSTFKNLRVGGVVKGGIHSAGLIGGTNSSPVRIENLFVDASVTTSDRYVGGVIGHAGSSDLYIEDCVSYVTLTANGADAYGGAIVGWAGSGNTWEMHRVYEHASFSNIAHQGFSYWNNNATPWGYNDRSTSCVSSHVWNEVKQEYRNKNTTEAAGIFNNEQPGSWTTSDPVEPVLEVTTIGAAGISNEELLAYLGAGWKTESLSVVPVMTNFPNSPTPQLPNSSTPQLPTFRHESIGKIDPVLKTETRQSSVLLVWTTDGNPIDFFTVMRRIKGQGDKDWQQVATDIDQLSYEDKTVSPLEDYEYKVRATNDCEGISYTETQVKEGSCKHTGLVEGYVRFNDGTGVPDINVEVAPQGGGTPVIVKTDEKGYFMADDLSYMEQTSITYIVSPVSEGNIQLEQGAYSVTFNDSVNHRQVREFTITNGLSFSAYVMYDGTSIPVKGAQFMVNGRVMHSATGKPVETDFEGRADFKLLGGVRQKIQTVMPGHTFKDDGYYKSADGVVLTDKVAQTYFYDATLVKLIGRVVGGDDQGSLPLDNSLSHNNLGQNLTMVLTLEGDNTSWLVYDNQNPTLSTRTLTFPHSNPQHKTIAEAQRKRLIVKPDSVTGEYVLMLPPVRWKVQQVYCEGYPTLFQDGQVSEVIDLTNCLTPKDTTYVGRYTDVEGHTVYQPRATYNALYSRIYHAPVEITYKQLGYDTFDYFGDKIYTAQTLGGDKIDVPLAYRNASDTTQADYTFGHPVFSLEHKYPIQISVAERYPWNREKGSKRTDVVRIGGGKVTIHNGMATQDPKPVQLDSLGQGVFILTADKTTRLLTGEDALKTVTMTLTQDGTTYEAEPLQGYVLNMFATGSSKDVLVNGQPQLIDILRDPPGGNSTATLSKGSKLKYTYTLDMKLHAGLALTWVSGNTLENFQGVVAAPEGAGSANGIINSSDIDTVLEFEYAFDMEGRRAFAYTMNVNQDITTSSATTMTGADADLYIGMVQNMVVTPMSTIRAIPDSLYQQMLGRLGGGNTAGVSTNYGSLVHIAEGRDAKGSIYHLVRDESIGYGPKVESQFVHSQKHILTELIPKKVQELRDLMFIGTAAEAQKLADATGKPVYRSLVDADDENFAVVNTKGDDVYYYTSTMAPVDSMNYVIHLPAGTTVHPSDEVAEKCQVIFGWVQMIAENEREKLNATELVTNYDVDGGSKVTYSEQFESEYTISNYYHLPGIISADYFDETGADLTLTGAAIFGVKIVSMIISKLWDKISRSTKASRSNKSDNKNPAFETRMAFYGKTFKFSILPTFDYDVKDVSGESKIYSRKESFTISMDTKSHLNFDLYRTQTDTAFVNAATPLDVFTNQNFSDMTDYVAGYLGRDIDMKDVRYARGFVYRTRGGATVNPWEDERHTLFYDPGRPLDERTKKISCPKITLDKQSVSGVAVGDPARFKVYMTNESEQPEAATGTLTFFTFLQDVASNPKGAKILVDGAPLTGTGTTVVLNPGTVLEKTMEVYAGEEFDYEGLRIGLASPNDIFNTQTYVSFDVHYLHEAGPVLIAQPGDKWVMNTNAQYDEKRGWFLPVTINGFNKHQHNFDHIEFQYKESLRGDDSWTNLCSYYADSTLMAKASGVREMIPENGNITTHFYGDGTVMEKAYDLRAVLYCRNGNSFLTTSSPIVSGVKDTRRPQLFGTPEPKNGLLTLGDNIIFNFTEDIEHNYLSPITNFEVKGEVNNNNVAETVSLQFDGKGSVETEARRNFSGKNLTIDMMVKPDETGLDMPLFSHGTNGKRLQLWLTKDFRLKAVVDEHEYETETTILRGAFTQVALVINMSEGSLAFYNGGNLIGKQNLKEPYNGTGTLIFGRTNENDPNESTYYKGRMMEARLWYRAMTGEEVGSTYGSKRLTGYEMGLVDYYPMNEGMGKYALDKTQGANAQLKGASWAMPRGLSLRVENDDKGIALTDKALNRTPEQDYTLMMWFKTDVGGRGVLLSNGAGRRDETNAQNQFCLGFEAEKLLYKTHGMTVEVPGYWSDGQWHHLAMTVNRSFNVANIYVDQVLRTTFAADSLGGISNGHPLIGAARYTVTDGEGHTETIDTRNWLTGYIDELCLFGQALPLTLIESYATRSPKGDEAGLLTYLAFDRQERQKDNDLELVAYPYSKTIYLDDKGNVRYTLDPVTQQPTQTPVRDYLFVDSVDVMMKRITNETAAPVVPNEELKNLNFVFAGKDNQIYVDINENNARLNHCKIYVTLRDVEDRNGNAMASPQTACYYVTNSSLQWVSNHATKVVTYGFADKLYFSLNNNSAANHTYTIKNCPSWLTLDKYTDRIAAQEIVSITGTLSKDLNVGTYDEILYLTDEEGVSEPLYLTLTVEAELPDWAWSVSSELLKNSMNIAGQVYLNDEVDIDSRDILGVFDQQNQCHGFSNVSYSALTGESSVYLTVYDNEKHGRELYFKLWQYATGRELVMTVDNRQTLTFKSDTILGTGTPVRFEGGSKYVQTFDLKEGWNWVSFNVQSEELFDLGKLLDGLPWQTGDILTDINGSTTLLYNKNGHWLATKIDDDFQLSPRGAYAIKVQQDIKFPVAGYIIKASDQRTILLNGGTWNGIGYTPMLNLTVETALSDYYDKAEPGDVIKSHDEFAYFTLSGGVGRWRGNLQYMKPGVGYMLLRKAKTAASFRYPFYEPGSTFIDEWTLGGGGTNHAPANNSFSTMSLSAVVEGFDLQEGDRLVAYTDGEAVGECYISGASALSGSPAENSEPLYLSIGGNEALSGKAYGAVRFAIERDGEIVAATPETMDYAANAVVGSPDEPKVLNFVGGTPTDISIIFGGYAPGKWYTTTGVQLQKEPTRPGLYIYNGKKITVNNKQ